MFMSNRLVEMETFVCVAENQNLVAAASELGVSSAFVTRRLQELERGLKIRLVSRTTRRISLTAAGKRYYAFSKRILKEIREEERALAKANDEPKGTITVASSVSFGILEMGKAITEFMVQYPLTEISLIIGDNRRHSLDPLEQDADVVVRFTRPQKASLRALSIGTIKWILCASPSYLKKAGTPRQVSDLSGHSCLVTTRPFGDGTWKLKGPSGIEKLKVRGVVSPNSAIAMRHMALDGAGIALLPTFCVSEDIQTRKLLPVLTQYGGVEQTIYACYADPRQQPLGIRLFVQFLKQRFSKTSWDAAV
jgi:DNA-binding transcriptional LysR family regulator